MHTAAPALLATGLPLGVLPLGTANDLARSLGIPDTPEDAAAIILAGRTRAIDLGTVNGIPFFNVASLGLSVAVTKRLSGIMKRRFGMLAYPLAAGLTIMQSRRFRVTLTADGEDISTTTLQIAVGNGRFYGGGNLVEANAEIDDGVLDVYSLEPRAWWRLLVMARAFRAGEHHKLREVRSLACRTLSVRTKHPHDVSADGEIITTTPAEFAVLPKAVRVFVP
jgi:diacylglycerol kinase (ATP)